MIKKILLLVLLSSMVSNIYAQEKVTNADVKRLFNLMKGFYSSKAQSLSDSSYFDIRLKMIPMWQDYEGYWLYVEQAMRGYEDKPYRQRVYQLLLKNDSTIESKVYTIKNGAKYYGAWKNYSPLAGLNLDSLEERKGCSILLHKSDRNYYAGSTLNQDCESSLKGALYATSKVEIMAGELHSWDQGFDKDNKQVWGAVKGGYEFVKYRYEY